MFSQILNRPTQLLLPATLNVAMSRSKIFRTANRGAVSQWKIVEQLLKKKKNRLRSEQFFIGKRLPDSRFERSLNVTLPRSMSVAKVTEYVQCERNAAHNVNGIPPTLWPTMDVLSYFCHRHWTWHSDLLNHESQGHFPMKNCLLGSRNLFLP